jgi:O-antigen/teichoic acid export membrane protein
MANSRTQNSFINAFFGIGAQVFTIILSFLARTIFIKSLSSEYLGINGLFANILTVLSLAELGLGNALVFNMYKPMKNNDTNKLQALMILYKKVYRIIALVVGFSGFVLSFYINYLIKNQPFIGENIQIIFLLYVFNSVISYLFAYKKSSFIVDQKSYIVNIYQQVFFILQLILQTFVLILTKNFYLYLFIQILCTFLNNVFVSCVANKRYPYIENHGNIYAILSKDEKAKIYSDVKALSISKIAGVVATGSDNIIISKLLGLSSVGLVSNYTLIFNSINGVIWNGLNGITASIGNFNVDATIDRRKSLFSQLFLCSFWLYGFTCICLLILINPFINLWLGINYVIPIKNIFPLILTIYIGGVNYPAFTYRTTLGYFHEVKYYHVLSAILNIFLSIILGKIYGLIGVFIATPISRLCTSEIADGYYISKLGLKKSPITYFIKYYLYFGIFIINYFVTRYVILLVRCGGILGFMYKTIACVFLSNLIFYAFFSKTQEFKLLIDRLKELLKLLKNNITKKGN